MSDNRPIGVFDSGVGGLTVVRALLQRLPEEKIIYFGDTAHVPYGNKSREQLFQYANNIISFLLKQDVKAIVVACGTHSSVTLPILHARITIPILGVVKPGARAAVRCSKKQKIGVMATRATVNSQAYVKEIKAINPVAEVYQTACTRLVPLIESGQLDGAETLRAVDDYTSPLLQEGIDTLIMGCTHYPFLAPVIKECTGAEICLLDPAVETSEELYHIMMEKQMFSQREGVSQHEFYVSGHDQSFYQVGRKLLGNIIQQVEHVPMD